MSKTTDNPVIEIAPQAETEQTETVVKVPLVQRAKTFVKTHKKSTIAVGALVGLVGLAAVTGRKETDTQYSEPLELMPAEHLDAEIVQADDTVNA